MSICCETMLVLCQHNQVCKNYVSVHVCVCVVHISCPQITCLHWLANLLVM